MAEALTYEEAAGEVYRNPESFEARWHIAYHDLVDLFDLSVDLS